VVKNGDGQSVNRQTAGGRNGDWQSAVKIREDRQMDRQTNRQRAVGNRNGDGQSVDVEKNEWMGGQTGSRWSKRRQTVDRHRTSRSTGVMETFHIRVRSNASRVEK